MTKTKKRPEFLVLPGLGRLALSGARPLFGILMGLLAGAGAVRSRFQMCLCAPHPSFSAEWESR
jgi:hypothetical protein